MCVGGGGDPSLKSDYDEPTVHVGDHDKSSKYTVQK